MFSKETKIQAILDYSSGVGQAEIMRKYGIKGSNTLYLWLESFKANGIEFLESYSKGKTSYSYSFKIKVITWRVDHNASYPVTARKFGVSHPSTVWTWERDFKNGCLKGRYQKMSNEKPKSKEEIKRLEDENMRLRIRVAYLEKLRALAQETKKSKTKRKLK